MRSSPYRFPGGTAVVTGAASGIGAALAESLADRRSNLALVDRDGPGLSGVAQIVRTRQPDLQVHEYVADLADTAALPSLTEQILADLPRPTLLVNNAGTALVGRFHEVSLDQFDEVLRINLLAAVHLTHLFLPALHRSAGSHIVNVSSVYGFFTPPGQTAYATSKFALRGFSEALRQDLVGTDIGVTLVHPGGVRTRIAANAPLGVGVDRAHAEAARDRFGRLLTIEPRDAAQAILHGVNRRRPRVLVGTSARVPDALVRVTPAHYGSVVSAIARQFSRPPR